jgi:hypothetical protein
LQSGVGPAVLQLDCGVKTGRVLCQSDSLIVVFFFWQVVHRPGLPVADDHDHRLFRRSVQVRRPAVRCWRLRSPAAHWKSFFLLCFAATARASLSPPSCSRVRNFGCCLRDSRCVSLCGHAAGFVVTTYDEEEKGTKLTAKPAQNLTVGNGLIANTVFWNTFTNDCRRYHSVEPQRRERSIRQAFRSN